MLLAHRYSAFLLRLVIFSVCAGGLHATQAQSIQQPATKSDFTDRRDFRVDPSTLALNLEITLGAYPQRGGASLPVTLFYSSKVHQIKYLESGNPEYQNFRTWSTPEYSSGWTSTMGVPVIAPETVFFYDYSYGNPTESCFPNCRVVRRVRIIMPDGSSHELRHTSPIATWTAGQPAPSYSGTYYAVDGSQMRYEYDSRVLFLGDGSRYVLGDYQTPTVFHDRNGNTRSYNPTNKTWTDSLGRPFTDPFAMPVLGDSQYSLPGMAVPYIFRWKLLEHALTDLDQELVYSGDCTDPNQLSSNFCCGARGSLFQSWFPDSVCTGGNLFNPLVLSEIVLPNGQSYKFFYNLFGEIEKIVYPSGGYERYRYEPIQAADWIRQFYQQANRGVVERWISPKGDGTDEEHWQYAAGYASINYDLPYKVTITAPDNSRTERYLHTAAQDYAWGFRDVRAGRAYEEQTYSASNQMLRRSLTEWTGTVQTSAAGNYPNARDPRITKQVELLLDTDGPALSRATAYAYDADNNVISIANYAFVEVDQGTAQSAGVNSFAFGDWLTSEETTYLVNDPAIDVGIRSAYRVRNLMSLPSSSRVKDGSGNIVAQSSIAYDQTSLQDFGSPSGWIDPQSAYRGNPTSRGIWLNTTNTYLITQATYDRFGNVRTNTDAKGNQSQIDYSDAHSFALPTLITSADPDGTGPLTALTTATEYNSLTGLVTATVDANGQRTTFAYDSMNRLTQTIRAVNGGVNEKSQTTINYDDTNRKVTTTVDQNIYNDNVLKSQTVYDGLGRPTENRQYEDASHYIAVRTEYDIMGRAHKVSNPLRPLAPHNETPVWTTSVFDALGRVITITTPGNAVMVTGYTGNRVLVADQVGRKRITRTDALGRLQDAWEITAVDGATEAVSFPGFADVVAGYRTSYSYDPLDNLITVNQGSQTREFVFDSLSRLVSATNPESGTVCFGHVVNGQCQNDGYDENGNLRFRTDARGVLTDLRYDALNRLTTKLYRVNGQPDPNTGDVEYLYDNAPNGKGRLWITLTWGAHPFQTAVGEYDALGNVKHLSRYFGNGQGGWHPEYGISATYDLAGRVKTMSYPSYRTVTNMFDDAGRLSSFSGYLGDGNPRTYSTGISYSPFGGTAQEQFGTTTPIFNKRFYNSRGQLAEIRAGLTANDTSWQRGAIINHFSDTCWGMCAGLPMTDNNGNVKKQEHWVQDANGNVAGIFTQKYEYDSLNRLQRVFDGDPNAPTWQQRYQYDRYGNRAINTGATWGTGINNTAFEVDPAGTNRLLAPGDSVLLEESRRMRYDLAGNLKTDSYTGAGSRTYDAENRMVSAATAGAPAAYVYDGDGERIKRIVNGVETWQVYGIGGELVAEYAPVGSPSSPQKEYGYRGGQLLVTATMTSGWGAPPTLEDNPLNPPGQPKTDIKAIHITQLRNAINALRAHHNYPNYQWVKPAASGGAINNTVFISWEPIDEMRTALDQALGAPSNGYTAGLAFNQPILAAHIQELRDRVLGAWQSGGVIDFRWLVSDQLGTPRIILDQSGSLANVSRHDYLPFGEELTTLGGRSPLLGYGGDSVRQKFTSKERDFETALDYFESRYHASNQGRFTSPDVPLRDQHAELPQSWNLYLYVRNNPLRYFDDDGHDVKDIRIKTRDANEGKRKESPEAGNVEQLGPKVRVGNFTYAVNIIVEFTADDSPENYNPVQTAFVIYPKGQNTDVHRPGQSDTLMSDNPEKDNVTRTGSQLIWQDNPGLQTSGMPPASVNEIFLGYFTATVKPKDEKKGQGKSTDKVLYWAVRIDIKDGKIVNSAAGQVTPEAYYKATGQKPPKPKEKKDKT